MIAATIAERSVLVSLLSLLLLFTGSCSEGNTEEKSEKRVPPSSKAKPVPHEVDTVRKSVQDSVQKPTQMMNYKSFRKSYTIHKRGYVVSLLSKLYKA